MIESTSKTCRICRETKPALEFYRNRRSKDGRMAACGPCFLARRHRNKSMTAEEKALARELLRNRSTRTCGVCAVEKPRSEFNSDKKSPDGLASWCKPCQAAWHRENYRRNREALLAHSRAWYEQNRERRRAVARAWMEANPGYSAERNRRRRALEAGGHVSQVDLNAIWTGLCALCGAPIDPDVRHPDPMSKSVDHIVPLSLGGSHSPGNVQWTHLVCNKRKGAQIA